VPQAIFFDLDSTIITWATSYDEVWERLCHRYAAEADGLEPARLLEAINEVRSWYWKDPGRHRAGRLNLNDTRREIARLAFSNLKLNNTDLADKIADAYIADREETALLVPQAAETLERLRNMGLRLAMITNGAPDMQRPKIEKFKLAKYFDNILIEGEFGCGKPDERVFRHTLKKLNVKPSDAWMVGDDLEFDIAPCRALGIHSLWVDEQGKGLPAKDGARPDAIIRGIAEIPGLL
jgi:putative hydrolase of the HAD superfamily